MSGTNGVVNCAISISTKSVMFLNSEILLAFSQFCTSLSNRLLLEQMWVIAELGDVPRVGPNVLLLLLFTYIVRYLLTHAGQQFKYFYLFG